MTITTQQKKAIDAVFNALAYTLDNLTHTRYMSDLYELERAHEKRHRNWTANFGRPDDYGGVSIATAAKYFAARHIIEGLSADWSPKDSLHLKDTVWRVYAIALNYGDEIKDALSKVDGVCDFLNLDYATMVQSKEAA